MEANVYEFMNINTLVSEKNYVNYENVFMATTTDSSLLIMCTMIVIRHCAYSPYSTQF